MSTPIMNDAITAHLVPENCRLGFLPGKCGPFYLKFERMAYAWMERLCEAYQGGYWAFYDLNNGGFFLALDHMEPLHLVNGMNGFAGDLSGEAAGIAVSLFALNMLACESASEAIIDRYYALRDYAAQHPERRAILALID